MWPDEEERFYYRVRRARKVDLRVLSAQRVQVVRHRVPSVRQEQVVHRRRVQVVRRVLQAEEVW